jgi:hypothetical protein
MAKAMGKIELGLMGLIGLMVITLLIGNRFGFSWAGGPGFAPHAAGVLEVAEGTVTLQTGTDATSATAGARVPRGATLRTDAASRAVLALPGLKLYLDERTDARVESSLDGETVVRVLQGRLVAETDHRLLLTTPHSAAILESGALSYVNYNFRQTVGVMPIGSTVEIASEQESVKTTDAWELHETPPIEMTPIAFDPHAGAAQEFYDWVAERTEIFQ